jgi:D-arabinose 5-phosphate isomerase GutQ
MIVMGKKKDIIVSGAGKSGLLLRDLDLFDL